MADPDANEIPQSRSQKLAALERQAEEAVRKNREDRKAAWPEEYKKHLAEQAKTREEAEREARFNTNLDRSQCNDPVDAPVSQQSPEQCADIPALTEIASDEESQVSGSLASDSSDVKPANVDVERELSRLDEIDWPDSMNCQRGHVAASDPIEEIEEAVKTYRKTRYTPWDRAKENLRLADEYLSKTVEGTTEHAIAKRKYDEALRRFKIEEQRDGDPKYRKWRSNDIWRAGEGKPDFNKSRRNVRDEPNADLSGMTPEQRRQRTLEQDRVRKAKKRKAENAAKAAAQTGGPLIT